MPNKEFMDQYYKERNLLRKALVAQIKMPVCTSEKYEELVHITTKPKELAGCITIDEWYKLLIDSGICLENKYGVGMLTKTDFNPRDVLEDEAVKMLIERDEFIPSRFMK